MTYVVTRNIQYTNVCYFRCGFCAFSKGKLARNLRGAPYLVPLEEIVWSAAGNLHNTAPFDVTGHPALSVPCAVSEGRPVGLMLVGRRFDDATVLRVGHAYEQARGDLGRP